jgi:NADH:ubiquinone oxidoreductase subunit H
MCSKNEWQTVVNNQVKIKMLLFGLYVVIVDVIVLLVVAFYTLVERKVIASIQRRRGPNVVGI